VLPKPRPLSKAEIAMIVAWGLDELVGVNRSIESEGYPRFEQLAFEPDVAIGVESGCGRNV
jgi:hypothetical protein